MDREIKFRGKDLKTGKWLYGAFIKFADKDIIVDNYGENEHAFMGVDSDTVGQFTGLYDANGEEIYDGDILTFKLKATRWKPVVTWNNEIGAWCVKMDMQDRAGVKPLGEWLQEEPFVVIGNIYDNHRCRKEVRNEH